MTVKLILGLMIPGDDGFPAEHPVTDRNSRFEIAFHRQIKLRPGPEFDHAVAFPFAQLGSDLGGTDNTACDGAGNLFDSQRKFPSADLADTAENLRFVFLDRPGIARIMV